MSLKHKHYLLFIFALVFQRTLIIGQSQTNNMGKDFWFTMLENTSSPSIISFAISSKAAPGKKTRINIHSGNLDIIDSFYNKDTIISFTNLSITPSAAFFINRAIHISSNNEISLYAMNNSGASTDIATIIPSENIPFNPIYYINTYRGDNVGNSSEISIVAIDDSCNISILPSADTKAFDQKDTLITRWLRKGELYWLHSQDTQSFAGSKIWNSSGCKRFAVFEGAKCARIFNKVGCSGCDHLFNQARPMQILGKEFTTIPFTNLTKGFVVQIVATENNTTLFIDGVFKKVMNEREVYIHDNTTNLPNCIIADKKISVAQLMKSGFCNGSNTIGNPSLMTLLPDNQLTMNVQFSTPTTGNLSIAPAEFYIGISCPKQNLNSIFINKKLIDTTKFSFNCNNAVGSIAINPSIPYSIESAMGFNAYLYVNGTDESYATELGGAYENTGTKLIMSPDQSYTCDTFQTFSFNATSDSLANYIWNFGDGTSDAGDSVKKAFNKTGVFKVQLITRYTHKQGCPADSTDKTLTIYSRPYFNLGKDTVLCKGAFYQVNPFTPTKSKYVWQNKSVGKSYTTGNSETVFLTVTDTNQCTFTDTMKLEFINCDTNSIKIPNVFTPGTDDELNDYLETEFTGFDKLQGVIYNRWGLKVYQFNYPENEYWNGGFQNNPGDPCPSGTYYYIYKFINTSTNLTKDVNGVVELIR